MDFSQLSTNYYLLIQNLPDFRRLFFPGLIRHHRREGTFEDMRFLRQFDPGTATAVAGLIREGPEMFETINADEGDMETALFVPGKAFADDFVFPDMKRLQRGNLVPVGDFPDLMKFGEVTDMDRFTGFILGHGHFLGIGGHPAQLGGLGVETGGEQPEVVVLEVETAAAFMDAALAEDEGLLTLTKSFTNEGPFLESDGRSRRV